MNIIFAIYLSLIIVAFSTITSSGTDAYAPHAYDKLPRLFWMHIQKTSSWIGDTALVWACPDAYLLKPEVTEPYALHTIWYQNRTHRKMYPCRAEILTVGINQYSVHVPYVSSSSSSSSLNHTIITMFRNPTDRLISAFLFNEGMMLPRGHLYPRRIWKELKYNISMTPVPILTYANLPGIASCQSKMLLGVHCGAPIALSTHNLTEAFRRLHEDVAYFGLTEEAQASLALFHAMFGGPPLPTIHNVRVNFRHTTEKKLGLLYSLQDAKWNDPLDGPLYDEAKKLFYSRCKRYGIKTLYQYNVLYP